MIRLGFSGGGYWGSNLVRAALKIPDVQVVAVADPDAGARSRIASLVNGDIKTYTHFEDMLYEKIDAVVIATPPALHVDQAVAALGRGKAVFLEKPPAMNMPDLDRLLNAARGKTLSCDYVFCHNRLIQFAKGLMTDFRLVLADLEWTNWGFFRKDVDCWWSVGPHPISVLCYLFEDVKLDYCKRGEGHAGAHLSIGDASAWVSTTWRHPIKKRVVELIGLHHSIYIHDVPKTLWVMKHNDFEGGLSVPTIQYGEPLVNALTDFVSCIRSGEEPVTGPRLIEKVTMVMCGADSGLEKE